MISIVTPSFEQLDWLRLAMASVADQQGVELEHIIQEGGSGLDPTTIVTPHVRLFIEPDAGMYDAINRGLRRARGEICSYLNCDEQYLPGALAKVANFFTVNPEVEILFGDLVLVNLEAEPVSYRRTILPTKRHLRLSHLNTTTCATFFRRQLLDRGFYFDPKWKTIGDAVWMDNLLRAGVRMATLPEPLAVFTITGKNLGDSAISRTEVLSWKGPPGVGKRFETKAVVLWHRIRKAFAGAYRRRRVEIDLFTLDSPDRRQRCVGTNVGYHWPSSAGTKT
jgi:glycosyltransferase involved in cell wall biosynthesis